MHHYEVLTGWPYLIITTVKIIIVFFGTLIVVALLTLMERKVSAFMQDRLGPNRVGPVGLLQPFADGLKNILKEETYPEHASRIFFVLAPMMSIGPALVTFAVVPFAAPLPTPWGLVEMIIADLPIGILYVLAITSLGVYGIVMAGWASNNKYSFLGGLRAGAQMVSYEVALGLSLIPVFFIAGNVTLTQIVWTQQQELHWYLAFPLGLSFLMFVISAFAETNRLPFDVPEAESELVTGYHTEYSSMKFSMFFIAEYANMVTSAALMATLFWGGWDFPFLDFDDMRVSAPGVVEGAAPAWWKTILTLLSFSVKTLFFIFLFMWVRWTVPRFRYDQVMHLGWKVLLPGALAYVTLMAASILILDTLGIPVGWIYGVILVAVNLLATVIFLVMLDRDRVISGTARGVVGNGRYALPPGITATRPRSGASTASEEARWR
jgi:NADH-quinone oxidoreductase subunit H